MPYFSPARPIIGKKSTSAADATMSRISPAGPGDRPNAVFFNEQPHRAEIAILVTPGSSREIPGVQGGAFQAIPGLDRESCPFQNLPERGKGRWGEGLTAEDMSKCRWLEPRLVAAIEFAEWTSAKETASDYTRSSNSIPGISDYASVSPAVGPRV